MATAHGRHTWNMDKSNQHWTWVIFINKASVLKIFSRMPPEVANKKRIIKKSKRKIPPCGESILNSNAGTSLSSNSQGLKGDGILDMHQRTIGEDGHYYECIICDNGVELLCCDTCPNTYHLQCLCPPLEQVPSGNWKCADCAKQEDLESPISHLQCSASQQNNSIVKVVPEDLSQSLHAIDEVGHLPEKPTISEDNAFGEEQLDTAKHIDDGKRMETSIKMHEPKVYRRRHKSQKVITTRGDVDSTKATGLHYPTEAISVVHHVITTSKLLNCSSNQSGTLNKLTEI